MKQTWLLLLIFVSCSSMAPLKREISITSTPSGADVAVLSPSGEYLSAGKTPLVVSTDLIKEWEKSNVEFITFKISQPGHIPENVHLNIKNNYNINITSNLKEVDVWSNKNLEMSSIAANKLTQKIQTINQLIFKKQLVEALKNTDKLIEEFPKAHVFYDIKGSIHYLLKNKREAISNYEKSLSLKPDNLEAKMMIEKAKGEER